MRVRRVLIGILGAAAIWVPGAAGLPRPALAQSCQTSISHLVDRRDSGNAGDWAFDNIIRTVQFCQTSSTSSNGGIGTYTFTLTDVGTFTTIPGANQPALTTPTPLLGPQTGTLKGGMSGTFKAKADFATYNDWADGQTFSGTPQDGCQTPSSTNGGEPTSCWIQEYFSDFTTENPTLDTTANFSWSYSACGVTPPDPNYGWIDAYNDGSGTQQPQAGNITGKPCPPSPTPQPTPTPKPTPTPSGVPGLPATGMDPTA